MAEVFISFIYHEVKFISYKKNPDGEGNLAKQRKRTILVTTLNIIYNISIRNILLTTVSIN